MITVFEDKINNTINRNIITFAAEIQKYIKNH